LRIASGEESIDFSCPAVSISMKGANEVQNMGAVLTYVRRYLFIMAFEIVECDIVDSMPLNHEKKSIEKPQAEKNNEKKENSLVVDIKLYACSRALDDKAKKYIDGLDMYNISYTFEHFKRDKEHVSKFDEMIGESL
jgi:hypothetical protein